MAIKDFFLKLKKNMETDDLEIRVLVFLWVGGIVTFLTAKILMDVYGWKFNLLNSGIFLLTGAVSAVVTLWIIDYFWPGPFGYKGTNYVPTVDSLHELILWLVVFLLVIVPLVILIAFLLRKMGIKGIPYPSDGRDGKLQE